MTDDRSPAILWLRRDLRVHDHPALFGYQLYDEPEYRAGFGLGVGARRNVADFSAALLRTRESLLRCYGAPRSYSSFIVMPSSI